MLKNVSVSSPDQSLRQTPPSRPHLALSTATSCALSVSATGPLLADTTFCLVTSRTHGFAWADCPCGRVAVCLKSQHLTTLLLRWAVYRPGVGLRGLPWLRRTTEVPLVRQCQTRDDHLHASKMAEADRVEEVLATASLADLETDCQGPKTLVLMGRNWMRDRTQVRPCAAGQVSSSLQMLMGEKTRSQHGELLAVLTQAPHPP